MWILPSLNRAGQCKSVIEQFKKNCTTPGLLFVNGGDTASYNDMDLPENWLVWFNDENIGVCGAMNKLFEMHPAEPWYGLLCDDEFITTKDFDKKLIEAAGAWKIAHGNDNWQSEKRIHGGVVLGGELVRTLGWMALPGLWHWFIDDTWEALARAGDLRVFLPDAVMEHRHWMAGKNAKDAVNVLGESKAQQDYETFMQWIHHGGYKEAIIRIAEKRHDTNRT